MKQLTRASLVLPLLLAVLPVRAAGQEVEAKEPNRGGEVTLDTQDPQVALQRLRTAEGYKVELFASEKQFPIGNPVAMAFDGRGRLWVSTMPTYPHYNPGDPPADKIIILEDTDGDGRADKHTVFADSLYLALGFELGDGGVYVSQEPNLMFLRDTDGDDRADERRIILHGFGTEDSHHAIHAFTWGPDGGLYLQEGTFLHSQVETPFGPVRLRDAGVFRYEPQSQKLGVFVSYPFANPWGHVFDRWGQNFIADASNGNNYFGLPITGRAEYPYKRPQMRVFTSKVRPTGGAEILSSRHFPDDVQGNFLVSNTIGFQGIKSHRVMEEGSGFTSAEAPPLLASSDINFRPIDMEVGPDGALYVVDWFNPLVGHMQYSLRDPRRDRTHGRIWRVTYPGRPLLRPVNLEALSVPELLDQLKEYEDRTRYRVRRELRVRDRETVRAELSRWVAALDPGDPDFEHHLLEALWVHQSRGLVNEPLLDRLLAAKDHRARAAATRALRFWLDRVDQPLARLGRQVNDPHPLVRLEAVVALSHIPSAEAAEVALQSLRHPTDYYLDYALGETIVTLEPQWKPALTSGRPFAADNPPGILFLLDRLTPEEVARVARSEPVNQELLTRSGIPLDLRRSAARDLAAARGTAVPAELLEALRSIDAKPGSEGAVRDLVALLTEVEPRQLRAERATLEQVAQTGGDPALRHGAYVALMRADGGVRRAWRLGSRTARGTMDLLAAAATVREPELQAELLPRVRQLLEQGSAATGTEAPPRGRYVRVEKMGCCETLSLAEVQVFDGFQNLAAAGKASQKSAAPGGDAERAIDGSTAGEFRQGSVSQSVAMEADPWWELDLGETRPISSVAVWKRTDPHNGSIDGFHLRILDSERNPVWSRERNDTLTQPIVFQINRDSAALVRRAAVRALASMQGEQQQRARVLAELLRRGVEPDLALAGLAQLAPTAAGGDAAGLAQQALAYARAVPPADRSGPGFGRAVALAEAMVPALPAPEAERLRAGLKVLLPASVRLRAVQAAMKFDLGEFQVAAGQEVELVFENPDDMPHNVLITVPGARELVGRAADAMAATPDGFQKQFIPDVPQVLFATKLIGTGETATLQFTAPTEPGEYPFICSFPGHWITMYGTMKVVPPAEL